MSTQSLTSNRLDFDDSGDALEHYFDRGWTDGLPIVPPTVEAVERFLESAGRSPSEILGTEPVKGRVITAEKAAINAVMAGCRPEYFPVVVAAVEAVCEPEFNLHAISVSTMGAAVFMVVGGPVAERLGINSGVGAFGPGHRANATIGRAVRLVMSNVTGAVSGVLDKATLGHAGKYTWCVAEADDVRPWEPLRVQRGLNEDQSAVTVFAGLSPVQVSNHEARRPEEIFTSFLDAMFTAGPGQEEIVVVLCPEHVGYIRSAGWSRQDVQEHLFERAQRSAADWSSRGVEVGGTDPDAMLAVALSPESVTPIVAGGAAGAFSAVIALWGGGSSSRSVTREVRLSS
ncbi:MAG: hypothetical protein IH956_10375 [Chloroflexi bacterium]|nr:hypothetical protein [Chloroflexota bacterium]